MAYCKNCENTIEEHLAFCPHCGKEKVENFTEKTEYDANEFLMKKDPFIAAILSAFLPGLGHVYNGDFKRGVTIQIGYIISLFIGYIVFILIFIPIIIIFVGVYDAYVGADKIRKGQKPDRNATVREVLTFLLWPFVLIGMLLTIVFVFVIIASIFHIGPGIISLVSY